VEPQNYEKKSIEIRKSFLELRERDAASLKKRLKFSWSNWGFGVESLELSAKRLQKCGVRYIELHGNRYGKDLGYDAPEVRAVLGDHGVAVSGICGMFSRDNDLSCNRPVIQQNAIDYIERNLELGAELGAKYFLLVPGAVGRP
jgi:D-psicose/D-tagatose/L-ribulose 3-epimerase